MWGSFLMKWSEGSNYRMLLFYGTLSIDKQTKTNKVMQLPLKEKSTNVEEV